LQKSHDFAIEFMNLEEGQVSTQVLLSRMLGLAQAEHCVGSPTQLAHGCWQALHYGGCSAELAKNPA
jgi:hypothetical protein